MRARRGLAIAVIAGAIAIQAAATTPAGAHTATNHTVNGTGVAGSDTVTVLGADQALDIGTVVIGTTTVTLSCVEVISSSSLGTHLVGMYGVGGGSTWVVTIRESVPVDTIVVTNVPWAPPTDANLCGIGNAGAIGTGSFTVV